MELKKTAVGSKSMVATGNPLAAHAAQSILNMGGTAVDAAISADAVLGVVEPMATSIGGDLLAMIVQPDGRVQSYNGTGRSPGALTPDLVEGFAGSRIPERHPLSITTPGAVRGWHDLHARYGRVEWARLFDAAITLAQEGFPVAPVAAREWALFDGVLHKDPHCAALYKAGNSPAPGARFQNPQLAAVLRRIANEGDEAFYQGTVARAAADAVQAMGGVLDVSDFAKHSGNYCEPVSTTFCTTQVYQCPPNTHGVAVLHALNGLSGLSLDPDDPAGFMQIIEATERAMHRASETVCDPAGNTVCTVVVDADGLAITLMSSIFKRFGSGIVVPGGGFVLQNRGFGFSAPGHINGVAPGKRPYHTVVPGACTRNGKFFLGMGVVGGLMQPQGQIQILSRVLAWDQALQWAIDAPRWRLEAGGTLAIEKGMPAPIEAVLRQAGYRFPATAAGELGGRSDFGGAHAVLRDADGLLHGAADPRKDGVSIGT
ncbi:gamma-glutamyltransferase [Candidimonas sp. SYP-B2681]|uniref:gamma-glutamyltransferase family protein n=1 Tax=Candidimonas sp. SYP-B2681 TaxID=2497686 RepID=UPI000F887DA2|nr:gamma-glutamyltransferase [Candidimonas sp. SYP-B2681]RTZ45426.1 gamma-glutamyltransferase [Candidimonas sp. SYP-B2681]